MAPKRPFFVRACVRWVWVPIVAFVLVVAVAMACAVWSPIADGFSDFGYQSFDGAEVPRSLRRYYGEYTSGLKRAGPGLSFFHISTQKPAVDSSGAITNSIDFRVGRSGAPFKCLRWTVEDHGSIHHSATWARGIETKRTYSPIRFPRRIPLMPEPVGMVLNVLIVSAVIVLVRLAWQGAVVFRRRRKGLCVKCAYPIEASVPRCPECGSAYPASAVPSRA